MFLVKCEETIQDNTVYAHVGKELFIDLGSGFFSREESPVAFLHSPQKKQQQKLNH